MLSKKTTIITVTYQSENIIESFLNRINNKFKIIVVENSNNIRFKERLEKKYKDLKCILTGSNIGWAKANNIGLKKINTKYSLIINPDTIINDKTLFKIEKKAELIKEFTIISPVYDQIFQFLKSKYDKFDLNQLSEKKHNLIKTNYVNGNCLFVKMKDIKSINYLDENFFFFFEEMDLCKRLTNLNKNIYILKDISIKHLDGSSVNNKLKKKIDLLRNWHFYWSSYYFHKKHYGAFKAVKIYLGKIIRFFFLGYIFLINKEKSLTYKTRFGGLISSILNKKANYLPRGLE
jgi:GT2 family glycosyltransferase